MTDKKSILDDALLDISYIKNALNENTAEILRSVAKEEINSVVAESIFTEEDLEDEVVDVDTDVDTVAEPVGPVGGDDLGIDDIASDESGLDGLEDASQVGLDVEPELGMDSLELGDEALDMTAASDDEVVQIYKKLQGTDEIEIIDGDIHLNVQEPGEYVIKTDLLGDADGVEADVDPLGAVGGDDVEYEVELDDESGLDSIGGEEVGAEEAPAEEPEAEGEPEDAIPDDLEDVDSEEESDDELDEAIRTNVAAAQKAGAEYQPKEVGALQLAESAKLVTETRQKYDVLLVEATKLKSENEEFRKALKAFKSQLVETVLFNSNLTYTTKLFMEHSTTKAEKKDIIERFDSIKTLNESKDLFKTISNELVKRTPIIENVENKTLNGITSGSSLKLNENTVYVDKSTQAIRDLMSRVDKR